MGHDRKSNACKYSVLEGSHQEEKQSPGLSFSLHCLQFLLRAEYREYTNSSGAWTILIFSVELGIYCLLSLDVGELGIFWKTIQNHCQVLQLSLPFCRKHWNCENYTS